MARSAKNSLIRLFTNIFATITTFDRDASFISIFNGTDNVEQVSAENFLASRVQRFAADGLPQDYDWSGVTLYNGAEYEDTTAGQGFFYTCTNSAAPGDAVSWRLREATGIILLSSTICTVFDDLKNPLYVVPAGFRCIPVMAMARDAGAFFQNIHVGMTIGFNATADDVLVFPNEALTTLIDTSVSIGASQLGLSTSDRPQDGIQVVGQPGDVLGYIAQDFSNSAPVTIDVFGYLIPA